MVPIGTIIANLDAFLAPEQFADYGPNGLQVPGTRDIDTIVTGVSASEALFERAAAEGAQLVLVHHGLFWRGMPQEITGALHRRLAPLFRHDVALAAYHLPLDAHPEIGNNALLADGLGVEDREPFAGIGMAGRFPGDGVTKAELADRVRTLTGREPLHLDFGPDMVRSIAIVSGGAPDHLTDAIAAGHDAYLTGEPAERVFTQAREAGVHFFGAGHYATETFGIRRLGDWLAETVGVRHVFLDDPNPI
jgi:dinuclear metal center YbgI/SA1388 family protein